MAVNDVPLHGKSVSERGIGGPEGSRVKLTVKSFCGGGQRDIRVTRQLINFSSDFKTNSRFVSLSGMEPLGCEDDISVSGQEGTQALYVPIKFFPSLPTKHLTLGLCEEFVKLQLEDIKNKKSHGMIIDLRGNQGGSITLAACMLNTLIHGTEVLLGTVPVKNGETLNGETTSIYFADERFFYSFS